MRPRLITPPGQSCSIAALSGSTNESYDDIAKASSSAASSGTAKTPTGSSAAGKQCITKYYKELHLKAPTSIPKASADTGAAKTLAVSRIKRVQGAACKPNINLFARGTTEPGTMGSTVGPSLSKALGSSKWLSKGVSYTADIAGDNCIGFPGGLKCVAQLAALAQECPDSKFFLSGYSQGAMVARICTAFSKDDVKAKIKVSNVCHLWKAVANTGDRESSFLVIRSMVLRSRAFLRKASRPSVRRLMAFARGSS